MSRIQIALLSICITICCSSPAFAQGEPAFSDVSSDDWFAPYVEVCVETGLMEGTGEGKFSPEKELTLMEAMVLTARLHAKNAGIGFPSYSLPADPYDLLRIYDSKGTQVGNLADLHIVSMPYAKEPMFVEVSDGLLEQVGTQAELTLHVDVRGLQYYTSFYNLQDVPRTYTSVAYEEQIIHERFYRGYTFAQEKDDLWSVLWGVTNYLESNGDYYRTNLSAETWYRDAMLYLSGLFSKEEADVYDALSSAWNADDYLLGQLHINDLQYSDLMNESRFCLSQFCFRGDLAALVCAVIPPENLPPLRDTTPPDTELAAAATLYQAGILTGVDSEGNFNSGGRLTRAEAAAVLARVIDPALRCQSSIQEGGAQLGG